MKDFFMAAFPWIAFSIGLALVLTHINSNKETEN